MGEDRIVSYFANERQNPEKDDFQMCLKLKWDGDGTI